MQVLLIAMLFLTIFNFYIPALGPSVYLAIVGGVLVSLINIKKISIKRNVISAALAKYVKKFIMPFLCIISIIVLRNIFSGGNDISFLIITIKMLLFCIASTIVIINIYIANSGHSETRMAFNNYLYIIGAIQSTIILFAIVNPSLADLIKSLQNNDSNNSALVAEGLRGVALSSMQFFGLATFYCLLLTFLANDFVCRNISMRRTIFYLILFVFSSIFVSRTAILGCIIFFIYIFNPLAKFSKKRSLALLIYFSSFLIVTLLSLMVIFPEKITIITEKVIPWAFEFIYSFSDSGKFATASTDELSKMYFPISELTFLIGDGRYAGDVAGAYYMSTDAGYMRPVLYGGFLLLSAMIISWIIWLSDICKNGNDKFLFLTLLFLSFLLQYKGEFIVTNYTSILTVSGALLYLTMYRLDKKASYCNV